MTDRDSPEQSYYPSCRVRLILRLEDFGAPGTPEPPAQVATARSGQKDKAPQKLKVVSRDGGLLLVGPGDDPSAVGSPQAQQGSEDELTHVLDGIIPITANFLRNGVRTADTASIEIPYMDLPVDPRVVRACGVQLFMGTVSADDYRRGVQGELRSTSATISGVKLPYNVLPDTYVDPYGRPRTNLRFEGWVDDWNNDWPDGDAPTVQLECTDNTRLLIDQDAAPKLTVSPELPIDESFADYLSNYPQFRGISVLYRPSVERGDVPVLKKVLQAVKYQPKLGPAPAGGGAGAKLKVWDYLTDVTGSFGHTLRFEGTTVIIQRARTLYDARLPSRPDDPFTGRNLPSGLQLQRRLYVYGKNVQSMKFSRKFATVPNVNIEVRCFPGATQFRAAGVVQAYRRRYSGSMRRILTADDRSFSVTPNHPMLTTRGWVSAGALKEGDHLVGGLLGEGMKPIRDPNVNHAQTSAREIFDALSLVWVQERRATTAPDFHGDVGRDMDVDVVATDGVLRDDLEPALLEHVLQLGLVNAPQCQALLERNGTRSERLVDLLRIYSRASSGCVGLAGESAALGDTKRLVSQLAGAGMGSQGDTDGNQSAAHSFPVCAETLAERVGAFPAEVATRKIVSVSDEFFEGHVYNLQTESNYYLAEGCYAHNCYDTTRKKTLVARFPLKGDRVKNLKPGNSADEKWIVKTVSGIKDEATLRILAQNIFEQVTRNELGCRVVSKNLGTYGGGNLDPDALDAMAGDAIDVRVMRDGDAGNSVQLASTEIATRGAEFMKQLGFSDRFARAYQKAVTHVGMPSTFRVKTMGGQFDGQNEGITLDFELMNYIEVRSDKLLPPGEELTAAQADAGSAVTVRVDDQGGS